MMLKTYFLSIALVFSLFESFGQHQAGDKKIPIIPRPQHFEWLTGEFTISPQTRIVVDKGNEELAGLAKMLQDYLSGLGHNLEIVEKKRSAAEKEAIVLSISDDKDKLGEEGYSLKATPEQILITGSTGRGVFYGLQSLYQLLPYNEFEVNGNIPVSAVAIIDEPRFEWRGMMLDVSRHFQPVSFVKKFIDYLAMYKMNSFHWHLTEDQGWRIEIKKYPELTRTGAWRDGTLIGPYTRNNQKFDGMRYGGYYTQEQIREVVTYAAERYINVVPEIEMPGHALAALATFPELSCTGGPFEVRQVWGVYDDVYCAGNEKTFEFLEDVLTEVVELFPSKIIHIGGDECPKTRWKACEKCQARIKAEGLKDEHELQSYFIRRMEKFLLTKGRNIIGWDEILEGGLAPNAAVMSWRGVKGGIAAAKMKHEVVMSPNSHLYFDHYQGPRDLEPLAIGGFSPLERVYSYEPVPEELTEEEATYIKGAQANLWTEYIPTAQKVEYMVMPRMAALSEVVWTQPELKDWEDFKERMANEYERYVAKGINFSKSAFNVLVDIDGDEATGKAIVSLKSQSHNGTIYYTLDGSEPSESGTRYNSPFEVNEGDILKAALFHNGEQLGKTTDIKIAE